MPFSVAEVLRPGNGSGKVRPKPGWNNPYLSPWQVGKDIFGAGQIPAVILHIYMLDNAGRIKVGVMRHGLGSPGCVLVAAPYRKESGWPTRKFLTSGCIIKDYINIEVGDGK
jgi:hypothetical protein